MKSRQILSALTFILVIFSVKSQGTLTHELLVLDNQGQPKINLEIVLVESSTFEIKTFRTNSEGKVTIVLKEGRTWVMHIGEMKAYALLKIYPNQIATANQIAVYDVDHWNIQQRKAENREGLTINNVTTVATANDLPDEQHTLLDINLKKKNNDPAIHVPVNLFCHQNLSIYESFTDKNGKAIFKVPRGLNFQVDIDGEENFYYLKLDKSHAYHELNLLFEKINFSEKENEDGYLIQTFHEAVRPVSNRVMVVLNVEGGPKGGEDEDVFIQTDGSAKKYYAKTGLNGQVIFLLPKGKAYHVSFLLQDNAHFIDLTRFYGISDYTENIYYQPEERLQYPERFLPTLKALKQYDINAFDRRVENSHESDNLIQLTTRWGNEKINSASREALLEVGFSINEAKLHQVQRKPVNLTFVIDRSASMGGDKIDIVKKALLEFTSRMEANDKLSIVFFESRSSLAYEHHSINKKKLENIIYALQAFGGTNIYEGLKLGYEHLSTNFNTAAVNRLVLLTDGYGSKPIEDILQLSEKYFHQNISVSTIGVGADCNQALLSLLSKYSGGFEHQVMESSKIKEAILGEFQGLFSPIASDLKIEIRYNNKIVYKQLFGIPEAKVSNNMVRYEQSEIFRTLKKIALIKFKLTSPDRAIENEKITVSISYFDETKQEIVSEKRHLRLKWTDESNVELVSDWNMKTMYSVATINQCLKAMADFCDNKDFKGAEKIVSETLKSLRKTNKTVFRDDLLPIIEELDHYLKVLKRVI